MNTNKDLNPQRTEKYLQALARDIHTTVVATRNEYGNPITAVIDMMDADSTGLYFVTAKGKTFYSRLKAYPAIAVTGFKGTDTMHTLAISLRGDAREIGTELLPRIFTLNPYLVEIYPSEESRSVLRVFKVERGNGEVFCYNGDEITHENFSWGGAIARQEGYVVTASCKGCSACAAVCPRACIHVKSHPAEIDQAHCIRCGRCVEACPAHAICPRDVNL